MICLRKIAEEFRPFDLAKVLPFRDAMRVAHHILLHDSLSETGRHYAIELLYGIRNFYSKEWNNSWLYDAYLGNVCILGRRYEERYRAYKQALGKVTSPPPELLVAYASCYGDPGEIDISEKESIEILEAVANKKPYKDVVRMLAKGCYKIYGEEPERAVYWKNLYQQLEKTGKNEELPRMIPNFLEEAVEFNLSKLPPPPKRDKRTELFDIAQYIFATEKIPPSVRGIAVGWDEEDIVLWVYHTGELDGDTESMALYGYERLAAHYFKDYSDQNNKVLRVDFPKKLPCHEQWVFLKEESSDIKNQ